MVQIWQRYKPLQLISPVNIDQAMFIWKSKPVLSFSKKLSRCKLLQKRSTGKITEWSKHLQHIAFEKYIFSQLNSCIFQTSLKYIKLVIPKILFILKLCNFNFYFKISWPSPPPKKKLIPPKNTPPPPPKQKFLPPPSSKDFSEIFRASEGINFENFPSQHQPWRLPKKNLDPSLSTRNRKRRVGNATKHNLIVRGKWGQD